MRLQVFQRVRQAPEHCFDWYSVVATFEYLRGSHQSLSLRRYDSWPKCDYDRAYLVSLFLLSDDISTFVHYQILHSNFQVALGL